MLKFAIVDDKDGDAALLKNSIAAFSTPDEPIAVDVYKGGLALLDNAKKGYDAVFLDIDMPAMNGLEVGSVLRKNDKDIPLIFVTRYSSFAFYGYEVSALDFLVKPVKEKDVSRAIDKIKEKIEHERNDKKLVVRIKHGYKAVFASAILYIEVRAHSLFFHTVGEVFEGYGTLKDVEKEFEKQHFCRCSNSYLINLDYIDSVVGDTVVVGGDSLAISRTRKKDFIAEFLKVVK